MCTGRSTSVRVLDRVAKISLIFDLHNRDYVVDNKALYLLNTQYELIKHSHIIRIDHTINGLSINQSRLESDPVTTAK